MTKKSNIPFQYEADEAAKTVTIYCEGGYFNRLGIQARAKQLFPDYEITYTSKNNET